ncbi:hypothetical protein LXA43DRAFT_882015 [Ganoderma leucocontextum]|nr:hypothetical protein LXA43DRAFT_882015 [Ganoderma leucocontextum]
MPTKPWDIYAEQLLPLGYGHPLWIPEPDLATHREVHIGDVGWLSEGQLHALFNTMSAVNDPINKANLMPKGFQTFRRPELFISKSDKITQQIVCSRGMSAGKVDRSTAPVTYVVRFEAEDAAFVALSPPGYAEDIKSRLFIYDYMRKNMDSWLELANGQRGLGLDDEDIVFVCGTVKTTHWAVAAFQGEAEGYVSTVCNAPFGEVRGFLVGVADQGLTRASHHRTGSSPFTTISVFSSIITR